MDVVAIRMLMGDRAKYLGLIFAIALSSFLIAQQSSIFAGLMNRTRSQILDVGEADIWVMDPATQYIDEVYPLRDDALYVVRGGGEASQIPVIRARWSFISRIPPSLGGSPGNRT